MFSALRVMLGASAVAYSTDAVHFDGSNDRLTRGADYTGNANSKLGIVSLWFNRTAGYGSETRLITNVGGTFSVAWQAANSSIWMSGENGPLVMRMKTSTTFAASGWHHFLASWDLGNAEAHIYVDDVDDLVAGPHLSNSTIDYTQSEHGVGASTNSSGKFEGDLADVYINFAEYLDFSTTSNRRKFIDSSSKPVDLGSDGSTPTGTAPIVFLHLDDGETPANNFAINAGGGGGLSVSGALSTAASSPSD